MPNEAPPTTYYGLPAVKRSHYGWLIATYFFVGGLAGAAQVIAQIADLFGGRREREIVRWGRYLALVGALLSPVLLIRDLHTSSRWYNMLRIVRPTSPMSIGSWTLAGFGTATGLAAFAQSVADLTHGSSGRGIGRAFGLAAALLGMVMAVYTGVLLSATSTPLWSVVYRRLPPLFGATAVSSATAALSLVLTLAGAPLASLQRLDRLAAVSGGVLLGLNAFVEREWKRHDLSAPQGTPLIMLATAASLLIHVLEAVTGRRSRGLACLAALATLAAAFAERAEIVFAGNRSSDRPEEYFRVASAQDE